MLLGKYIPPVTFWVLPPPSESLQLLLAQAIRSWNSAIPDRDPEVGAVLTNVEFAPMLILAGGPLVLLELLRTMVTPPVVSVPHNAEDMGGVVPAVGGARRTAPPLRSSVP